MTPLYLSIAAQPVAWARAGTVRGHHYTPTPQRRQMDLWVQAWIASGVQSLGKSDLAIVNAQFVFERPPSHWTTKGKLSAAGRRAGPPRLDLDNLLKLPTDALQGHAYVDDKQIVEIHFAKKRWTEIPAQRGGALIGLALA